MKDSEEGFLLGQNTQSANLVCVWGGGGGVISFIKLQSNT